MFFLTDCIWFAGQYFISAAFGGVFCRFTVAGMLAVLYPSTWSTFEHSSHSSHGLVDVTSSRTDLLSLNLHVPHRKRRADFCRSLQGKVIRQLKTKSRNYQSIQCNVGSAQNELSSSQEAFQEEKQKKWEECREPLSILNFSVEEVDSILAKSFGWVNSPYWGEERKQTVPDNSLVSASLSYLRSLGLSDDDLHKLLKKFPEVLGCSLENDVKNNVATLEREWGIKGNSLRNLLLRNPKVLGYNVDCKGDCMAQCTRCWVRF